MKQRLFGIRLNHTQLFAVYGFLFGLTFPIAGTILEVLHGDLRVLRGELGTLYYDHPAIFIIWTAPLVLGLMGYLVGVREDRLAAMASRLEEQVAERTAEITRQNQFYEALVQGNPLPIVTLDSNQDIVSINPAFTRLYGFTTEETIGQNLDDLIADEQHAEHARTLTYTTEGGEQVHATGTRMRKDGSLVEVEIHGVPVVVAGAQVGVLAIYHDITERVRAEQALRASETRYRRLFDDSPISIWEEDFSGVKRGLDELRASGVTNLEAFLDRNQDVLRSLADSIRIRNVNEATLQQLKASSKEELFKHLPQILGPTALAVMKKEFLHLYAGATSFQGETRHVALDGEEVLGDLRLSIAPGYEDTWEHVIVSVLDITERKKLERQLRDSLTRMESLARTDSLTGLYNRRAITEHALAELARAERENNPFGLAMIDMDNLKTINDVHGHLSGDAALRRLGESLVQTSRLYDRVGRWGGDEFLLVLPHVTIDGVSMIAERILRNVRKTKLVLPNGEEQTMAVSIGITACDPSDISKITLDDLLSQADQALYQAKLGGRNMVCAHEVAA